MGRTGWLCPPNPFLYPKVENPGIGLVLALCGRVLFQVVGTGTHPWEAQCDQGVGGQRHVLKGYTWCFSKCFLFDFFILVFSEKALASSNSFLRVAERKQAGEWLALNQPSKVDSKQQV